MNSANVNNNNNDNNDNNNNIIYYRPTSFENSALLSSQKIYISRNGFGLFQRISIAVQ